VRVRFDQGTPVPLRKALEHHEVTTAFEQGWSLMRNGDLLDAAEAAGFEVFVTTDLNLKYQQNLAARTIAVVALGTTSRPRLQDRLVEIVRVIDSATGQTYVEIPMP
jgi:hypothetical protein